MWIFDRFLNILWQNFVNKVWTFMLNHDLQTYFFMLAFNKSLLLFLLLPFRSLLSMLSLFAQSLCVTTSRTSESQIKFSSRELAATRFATRRGSELFCDAVALLTPLSHLITLCSHAGDALEHTFRCTH